MLPSPQEAVIHRVTCVKDEVRKSWRGSNVSVTNFLMLKTTFTVLQNGVFFRTRDAFDAVALVR